MIPRTLRFFPWILVTLMLLAGGCGGGGGGSTPSSGGNIAPTLNPITNQVVVVGNTLSFLVTASDPNIKDTVRLFVTGLPTGAVFSTTSGQFLWTPAAGQTGDFSVTFIASDGLLEVSRTIIITVSSGAPPANLPPALNPIGNQSVQVGRSLSFTVTASDPNSTDTVVLSVTGLPQGASFNPASGAFLWSPIDSQIGDHSLTFHASDGRLHVSESIVIGVTAAPVNTPPVLTLSTEATSLTENQPLNVTFAVNDAEGDPLTLSASELPPGATFDPVARTFNWTPQLVTPAVLPVVFTLSDGVNNVSKTLTITYTRTNPLLATDITNASLRGITIFPQTTPALDDAAEVFPGQANFWDLDRDVAQVDGYWNQFQGNMVLAVQTTSLPLTEALFPNNQTYAELTFMTPLLTALDGLRVAEVATHADYTGPDSESPLGADPDEGNASAWLNATADSRLQQVIDLSTAGGTLTLTWKDQYLVQAGDFPGVTPYYRVMATDLATNVTTQLFAGTLTTRNVVETTPSRLRLTHSANLSTFAGKRVRLSFELRGAHQLLRDSVGDPEFLGSFARIDNVSVRDVANTEYVVNGGFENGLTGWTANAGLQSQNLRAAPRTVNGLTVTRHFYSAPNQLWARWTDVLTNNTGVQVDRRVVLRTFLGSAGFGIIYLDGSGRALTSWDGTNPAGTVVPDRDVGLVFGGPAIVNGNSLPGIPAANVAINANNANISARALNTADGSDIIEIFHDVSIPANGKVTLVHFALMSGVNTGDTAVDTTARASTIDTEIANILANFCSNPRYRDGMTTDQLNSLLNFTCR